MRLKIFYMCQSVLESVVQFLSDGGTDILWKPGACYSLATSWRIATVGFPLFHLLFCCHSNAQATLKSSAQQQPNYSVPLLIATLADSSVILRHFWSNYIKLRRMVRILIKSLRKDVVVACFKVLQESGDSGKLRTILLRIITLREKIRNQDFPNKEVE